MNNIVPLSVENMNLADAMGFSASTNTSNSVDLYRVFGRNGIALSICSNDL